MLLQLSPVPSARDLSPSVYPAAQSINLVFHDAVQRWYFHRVRLVLSGDVVRNWWTAVKSSLGENSSRLNGEPPKENNDHEQVGSGAALREKPVWHRAMARRQEREVVIFDSQLLQQGIEQPRESHVGVGLLGENIQPEAIRIEPSSPKSIRPARTRLISTNTEVTHSWLKSLIKGVLLTIMTTSLIVLAAVVIPDVVARLTPSENIADVLDISQLRKGLMSAGELLSRGDDFVSGITSGDNADNSTDNEGAPTPTPSPSPSPTPYIPPLDTTLPEGQHILIPSIGVNTPLRPTENPDEALEHGVWLVPDFGRPDNTTDPIIVAAHRFGWTWWWQSDYWRLNSFYLLPDTQPGDRIEIIYDQRKYVYEIYAGEEGDMITDYSADLILYTCKFLNSPVRHFRYARLIDPAQPEKIIGRQLNQPKSDGVQGTVEHALKD